MDVFDQVADAASPPRTRRRVPVGALRNGEWFDEGDARKPCIGRKLDGDLFSDVKAGFLKGHHSCGQGPFNVSSMTMVVPIDAPDGEEEVQDIRPTVELAAGDAPEGM